MSISYCVGGRFANNLIQYFATKVLCRLTGKEYKYKEITNKQRLIGDLEYVSIYNDIKEKGITIEGDILLTGFYQSKEWMFPEREYLKSLITIENEDRINDTYKVSDLAREIKEHNNTLSDDELVIHVRLDDYFHQGYNSDVIHPQSLIQYVNTLGFKSHTIVCDHLRFDWERKYIEKLLNNIPNSKVTTNSLLTDFCIMYYAKNIVVSRSTFSWMSPILSPYTERSWFPLRSIQCKIQTIDSINNNTVNYTPNYLTSNYL
jgi:hypothetical protein